MMYRKNGGAGTEYISDLHFATTGTGWMTVACSTACYAGNEKNRTNKRRDRMSIYRIYLVDRVNCEVLIEKLAIADSESNALLGIVLTDAQTKRLKKDELEFVITEQGSFEKIKYTRVLNIKDED